MGERNDSIGGNPVGNLMIDHVSASWGLDENMSMYGPMFDHDNDPATPDLKLPTVNITIQHSTWEKKHQLDPSSPSDTADDPDHDGYTNVEEFLNGTDPRAFVDYTKPGNNVDKLK